MSAKKKQLEIAERLQLALLQDFERLLASGELTPTDRATLSRLLMQNGWSIDPAALPQGIRDKLTSYVPLPDDDEVSDDELFGAQA